MTPLCSPTPAGPEAPFESSPSPLLPLARLHLATPSRRFQPPTFPFLPLCLPSSLSGARFKTDFLFSPFDSLILSSLSLSLFPFSFRPSPRQSLYRCLPHLLVAEDEERGGDGDLEREEPKSSVVAAAAAATAMVRTKKGQSGSGEPDCSQRDLIMNHNERASAYTRAMEPRISRWRGLTFIYAKRAHARYIGIYIRLIIQRENVKYRRSPSKSGTKSPLAAVAIVSAERLACNSFRYRMFVAHLSLPST